MFSQIFKCKPVTRLVFEKAAQIFRRPCFHWILSCRLCIEKSSKIAFGSGHTKNDQAGRNNKSVINKETRKNTDFRLFSHSWGELKWWKLIISSILWSFSDTITHRLDALFRLREVDWHRIYLFCYTGPINTGNISDPIKTEARFSKHNYYALSSSKSPFNMSTSDQQYVDQAWQIRQLFLSLLIFNTHLFLNYSLFLSKCS